MQSRGRVLGLYWMPVVIWMGMIFWGSTDALSANRTSRFLGPLLRWLVPGIQPETEQAIRAVIRKGGHVTEYAVLAVLLARALRFGRESGPRWRWTVGTWAVATGYAMTDEFHQSFYASRQGSWIDVGIDSVGAALGVLVFVKAIAFLERRRRPR